MNPDRLRRWQVQLLKCGSRLDKLSGMEVDAAVNAMPVGPLLEHVGPAVLATFVAPTTFEHGVSMTPWPE